MTTPSMQDVLRGLHFPAAPDSIRKNARQKGAAPETMALLDKLPERSYKDLSEINHSLGQIEDRGR